MFVMRISYLIGAKLQQSSLFTNACHSYFIKAIEHLFYEFTGVINPRAMLLEHEKSLYCIVWSVKTDHCKLRAAGE